MKNGADIYRFTADYDHRESFGGNADLVMLDNGNFKRSMMFGDQDISNLKFEFKIQNTPLVEADMLSVEGRFSGLLVMSEAMIEILNRLNEKSLNCSAVQIQGSKKNRFSVVQVPVLDIFDWENSEYDKGEVIGDDDADRLTGNVEKFVFTIPDDQLPAAFRIKTAIGPVFMRGDARKILKESKIRGVSYMRPGRFSSTNQFVTDLPVIMPRNEIFKE